MPGPRCLQANKPFTKWLDLGKSTSRKHGLYSAACGEKSWQPLNLVSVRVACTFTFLRDLICQTRKWRISARLGTTHLHEGGDCRNQIVVKKRPCTGISGITRRNVLFSCVVRRGLITEFTTTCVCLTFRLSTADANRENCSGTVQVHDAAAIM